MENNNNNINNRNYYNKTTSKHLGCNLTIISLVMFIIYLLWILSKVVHMNDSIIMYVTRVTMLMIILQ